MRYRREHLARAISLGMCVVLGAGSAAAAATLDAKFVKCVVLLKSSPFADPSGMPGSTGLGRSSCPPGLTADEFRR